MRKQSFLSLITTTVILLTGCSLQNDTTTPQPQAKATFQIVATTANKDMTINDIKPILDYRAQMKFKDFKSEIIDNKLVISANPESLSLAAAQKLTETNQLSLGEERKNFTADEIARKKAYNDGQKESMNKAYEEAKKNPESFDSIVTTYSENPNLVNKSIQNFQRKEGLQKEIADTLFSTGTGAISKMVTTDSMIWFAKILDQKEQEEVTAQHILISYIGSQAKNPYLHRTKAQAEKFVNEIKDTITPKNFGEKAKELSDDSSNSGKGGSLGSFSHGQMTKVFEDAAFSAKINTVVGPIESEFGWHFILVTKKETVPFVKYQDVVRFLKPLTPTSGYVSVLHIGNEVKDIKAQVRADTTTPNTGTGSSAPKKDYRLVITLTNKGKQMITDFAKNHTSMGNLALMIDDSPYWKLASSDQINSDGTLILQGELTEEQVRDFSGQMRSYSLPTAIQLIDYQVETSTES